MMVQVMTKVMLPIMVYNGRSVSKTATRLIWVNLPALPGGAL